MPNLDNKIRCLTSSRIARKPPSKCFKINSGIFLEKIKIISLNFVSFILKLVHIHTFRRFVYFLIVISFNQNRPTLTSQSH